MVRQHGAPAFRELLERRKKVLFDVLIEKEELAGPAVTPEQRAALGARLQSQVSSIADSSVRRQYQQELKAALWARDQNAIRALTSSGGRRRRGAPAGRRNNAQPDWRVRERVRLSSLFHIGASRPQWSASGELASPSETLPGREVLLMRTLIHHPWLLDRYAEEIAALELASEPIRRLRDGLLTCIAEDKSLDTATIRSQLERLSLQKVLDLLERIATHRSDRFAEPDADPAEVETGWRHTLALHNRQTGLIQALKAAERAWHEECSEDALARICEIQRRMASRDDLDFPTET
jgi:DNA primase